MEEKYIKFYMSFHKAFQGKKSNSLFELNQSRWSNVAGCSYSDITPVIEFTAELQSNDLTYHKPYTKRQQITYNLIRHLHDVEGVGLSCYCKEDELLGYQDSKR
jgi:hypothetical protein